jgi:hypothetical protein
MIAPEVKASGLGEGAVWDKETTRDLMVRIDTALKARTAQGISASGAKFAPYETPGYGDTPHRDLRDTGEMLGSVRVIKVSATGGTLACTLRHPRAVFRNRADPFMGVLVPEAEAALTAADNANSDRLATQVKSREFDNRAAIGALRGGVLGATAAAEGVPL